MYKLYYSTAQAHQVACSIFVETLRESERKFRKFTQIENDKDRGEDSPTRESKSLVLMYAVYPLRYESLIRSFTDKKPF